MRDKETKRNELVRVGRIRFAEQTEEVQARFFDMVQVREDEPQITESQASTCGVAVSRSPDAPATSSAVVCTPALLQETSGDSAVKIAIMAEFTYLQKKFPGPRVFDVLAAAFRLLGHIEQNLRGESDGVKAAICLGMGAKLASVSPSHTLDVWRHFTAPKMLPYLRSVEVRMVVAWAKHGL